MHFTLRTLSGAHTEISVPPSLLMAEVVRRSARWARGDRLGGAGCCDPHPQRAAGLLDDVDGLQVGAAPQPRDRVHRQRSEVVLVVRQDLAAQRRARDVQQVLRARVRFLGFSGVFL